MFQNLNILDLNNLNRKYYNAGTFSDGPFNPNVDPIGALITFVGCSPGNDRSERTGIG